MSSFIVFGKEKYFEKNEEFILLCTQYTLLRKLSVGILKISRLDKIEIVYKFISKLLQTQF